MAAKSCKTEIFRVASKHYSTTLWVQNSLEIALSLTVSEIFEIFHFPQKFKMAAKSCKNEIFAVSEIFAIFHFPQKFKMVVKSCYSVDSRNFEMWGQFPPMS